MGKYLVCAVLLLVAGCGWRDNGHTPSPVSDIDVLAPYFPTETGPLNASSENTARATEKAKAKEKPSDTAVVKTSTVDIDKVLTNPWLIAGAFLAIQWFEIWYFNRTGKKSATIDAAEAAMQPKLGIIQRVLYRLWRWIYFWKNKDKKDPDKEEEKK